MGVLSSAIEEFTRTSGLNVNKEKSVIFFSNVGGFDKQQIMQDFGLVEGSLPVKYLGLPLA